jgi:hypothetical protein
MGRTVSNLIILTSLLLGAVGVGSSQSYDELAVISRAQLRGGKNMSVKPLSAIGVILLAIENCTVEVNGSPVQLMAGERRFVHGKETVKVSSSSPQTASLLIVNVRRARQAQTFDRIELASGKVMEDASTRNETLVVNLEPLRLRDIINRSDEDEPPSYSQPRVIELGAGETAWLEPGMHHITNVGASTARFVTIEW